MEFRWVAFITLWTILVGPIVDMSVSSPSASQTRAAAKAASKMVPGR